MLLMRVMSPLLAHYCTGKSDQAHRKKLNLLQAAAFSEIKRFLLIPCADCITAKSRRHQSLYNLGATTLC